MKHLIIGCGSAGRRHLRNLQTLGEREIVCLRREADPRFEKEMGVEIVHTESAALATGPETVFVCTPTSMHLAGFALAAEAKAHVFVEKPFVTSASELAAARKVAAGFPKLFFIGYMLRYHPMLQRMKQLVREQPLGRIYAARFEFGSYLPGWHPKENYRESYAARECMGGGVLNTIAHELDLAQDFFGDPAKVSCLKKNFGILGIDAEELCEMALIYNDKLVTVHLDYLQKEYHRAIRVECENGVMTWDWKTNVIRIHQPPLPVAEINAGEPFEVNQLYLDELSDFLSRAKSGTTRHPLDWAQAERNTELLLALHAAAASGEVKEVSPPPQQAFIPTHHATHS